MDRNERKLHFYVWRLTPCHSSSALLMTCNLSSYQILTNSIRFHWLLFISTFIVDAMHFLLIISSSTVFFPLSFSGCNFHATYRFSLFHLYVPFDCCLFYSFFFLRLLSVVALSFHIALPFTQLLWNYIECSVLNLCLLLLLFLASSVTASSRIWTTPVVKPNNNCTYSKHLVIQSYFCVIYFYCRENRIYLFTKPMNLISIFFFLK